MLEQTPEAGTKQPAGTQIVLIVTTYVAPTRVSVTVGVDVTDRQSVGVADSLTARRGVSGR